MSIREEITHRSTSANRIVVWWAGIEGAIRLGIWIAGWSWLKSAEKYASALAVCLWISNWIDFRIMQITQAGMEEMEEYIDKSFEILREELQD